MSVADPRRIRPRRVRFDWSDTPLSWVPGDPFASHVMDVLHLLLPAGEYWFCDVYTKALPLITDRQIEEDVRGFIGQEATHSRAHAAVLDHLESRGLDTRPFTRRVDCLFDRLLADEPFGRKPPRFLDRPWLVTRLAIIAAIEHFTCVLGIWILADSSALDRAGADPMMLDLLRWHGAEEVEHRSVAFDLYQHVSGSYFLRLAALAAVASALFILWRSGTLFFLRNDPEHPDGIYGSIRHYVRVSRTGKLPRLAPLAASVGRYLKPGHHPSREGSTERALGYLATSSAYMKGEGFQGRGEAARVESRRPSEEHSREAASAARGQCVSTKGGV